MKRTGLVRRTPLRPGKPLRRSWIKPKAKPNPMPPGERDHVVRRDGKCIIRILVEDLHWLTEAEVRPCGSDFHGSLVRFEDLDYNHVRPAAGAPRPSNRRWACAVCPSCNSVTHQVSKFVGLIRRYLEQLEAEGRL